MNLYAESSAVLAWLLDEAAAPEVRRLLGTAIVVVASDLTLIECDRVLLRAAALGEISEADSADRRAHLAAAASQWQVLHVAGEVVEAFGAGLGMRERERRERGEWAVVWLTTGEA